jgi:hypothetical protein
MLHALRTSLAPREGRAGGAAAAIPSALQSPPS